MTSIQNNSNILIKEPSSIFEQIRKKAEDISTSEGSYGFLHNLSNPTNLTNPQIIAARTVDTNIYNSGTKKDFHLYKIKTRNKQGQYKPDNTSSQSNRTELIDQLLINEQIRKFIRNKKNKLIFDKNSESQKIYNYSSKRQFENHFKKNTKILPIGNDGNNLWTKFQNENDNNKGNKIEKLNTLINIRKSELDTLNSNIESLENNKETIIINYNKKYVSYINYLTRQKDKEEKNDIDLIIKSGTIRKEIAQIQSKINKVQKEKMLQLNLILLFIQIKEKIRKIPEMAYKYFGTCDKNLAAENAEKQKMLNKRKSSIARKSSVRKSFVNKFKENIIINEDLKKIMKYKGKLIYNDIFEFDYDFNQLKEKVRKAIELKEISEKNNRDIKKSLALVKVDVQNEQVEEMLNHLNFILNNLKNENADLKSELKSLKLKYSNNLDNNNEPYFLSKNINISSKRNSLMRKSSSANNILQNLTSIQNNKIGLEKNYFNSIFANNFNSIYSPKNIISFKKYFLIEKFDFNSASNLFLSCYKLYNITKENYFSEKDIQFDIEIKRGSSSEIEKSTILKMLEYIDNIVSLLLIQKRAYLKDKYLNKKYKKIRDLLEKDKRRMNFIKSFKSDEEKRKIRLRKINLRKEKGRFIPYHKVEFKYFFKNQKEQIAQANNLAGLKRSPTFEDFMFDIIEK